MSSPQAAILLSELRHVTRELQRLLGQPVRQVWVPSAHAVALAFGDRSTLLVESFPCPRVHTVEDRPGQPRRPLSFQGLLRARVHGPLLRFALAGDDRVVELEFGSGVLHARLFGRGGGIWWLEGGEVVAASHGPAPSVLPPLPPAFVEQPPRFEPIDGSWDLGARTFLGALAASVELQRWRQHVRRGLARAHKKERRLHQHLSDDLVSAEGADRLREDADCLAAALHRAARGAAFLDVDDLFEPGAVRRITLDPRVEPSRTLTRMYDKAGRLDRAIDQIFTRLDACTAKLQSLEQLRGAVDLCSLEELRALAAAHGLGDPSSQSTADAEPAVAFRRWWGPNGEEVWVGRNDAENHELTLHRARGRDWWFHLRDEPGAHVVLRGDKRHAPPLATLLAAAQIVLKQARVTDGESRDVQYARVKDLRSVPGAGLGRVAVTNERVLHVTRDDQPLLHWTSGPVPPSLASDP